MDYYGVKDPKNLQSYETFRTPYDKVSDETLKNDKNLETSILSNNIVLNPIEVNINQINSTNYDRPPNDRPPNDDMTPNRPPDRTFGKEDILEQNLAKYFSKAEILEQKLDESINKMEILDGKLDKILNNNVGNEI